ncbi:ectonucleotide pyrophosphatase/phosphodiesterase family member 5-like [Bacillus rossius redtenbacheri]|uniref:ectonucleotide pyrophosphatase/phosphodiesterase family member 5-like n=1 Tax=Bacillus rossius redtenbacheri TaxID=93214 RepID=UPI002FDE3492
MYLKHLMLMLNMGLHAVFIRALSKHPLVLIVSFDGFRYNYFNKNVTPTLESLKLNGTYTMYMKNVFQTKTFPNHHSIATGVYPEVHGVLAPQVYDPKYKTILKYSYELWHYNEDILPIWIVNEKAGDGRHSGTMMWPGSDFKYQDTSPTFQMNFNVSVPWERRVDTALEWFLDPVTPANLVMLYVEEPDASAHVFGPESQQVLKQIAKVDSLTGYLRERLRAAGLLGLMNVFQVSDHGMDTVSLDRIINLTGLVDSSTYELDGVSPVLGLIPVPGAEDQIYAALKNASLREHFEVYRRAEVPERWHFARNRRAPPLLAVADEGYAFDDFFASRDRYIHHYNVSPSANVTFGMHGYDNSQLDMLPFFLAWGPAVRRGHTVPPFDTVDLFPLWAHLLGVACPPGNGSLEHVRGILAAGPPSLLAAYIITLVVAVAFAAVVVAFVLYRRNKQGFMVLSYRKMGDLADAGPEDMIEGQHLLSIAED